MTERIAQKIMKIREYLRLIEQLKDDCEERFHSDPIYRGALLHYLYLTADTCIALAMAVIRFKALRLPQSYHEAFDILGEAHILEPQFAYSFAAIAGFRNFLAHDYEQVDARVICKEVINELADVEIFLQQVTAACGI